MTTVGVIGTGHMGSALVRGWLRADAVEAASGQAGSPGLVVWDKVETAVHGVLESGRVKAAGSLEDLVAKADVILVAVKPKDAAELLGTLRGLLGAEQVVISAMAGVALEKLRGAIGPGPEVFRIMPNLGVELAVGAVAVATEEGVSAAALGTVLALFRRLGLVEVLPEEMFDAVTAVSGSSPAFFAVAIESLEDGAVAVGLSRTAARTVVRQTALATARNRLGPSEASLALGESPVLLGEPDSAAMRLLEERGVRLAFQRAVQAAVERSRRMSNN